MDWDKGPSIRRSSEGHAFLTFYWGESWVIMGAQRNAYARV